ncbi:nuclear transport factor 2 family protein [Mammaliicoccus sciuri]|uniref:nuclear transport factor 2 family protein n=1 Tax=Mammaliicoccus sciuri TaxID=1296 RepID=UPI001E571879|nr:nuclear transport factor 2 family protein [Mammaliicoccus sciuri]MCD8837288.1 nuclear transport factor 2 family protein [Mammaliicoccus sciuri]MCJ0940548.1 nuclear transport factor 2 family protein [Mammaliicoccus sciuri]MCJ0942986.1 nuclear transport factor 2 family protein [Mammaliicoccus sciuri]MCJ0965471.1 nuclear transport factor 2 family protein [Mammaliicoccus sciuri]
MSNSSVAESFSTGHFDKCNAYLDQDIEWHIVGDTTLKGYEEVENYCTQVSHYFETVTTQFEIHDTIKSDHQIVVIGTGYFYKEGIQINKIDACDIYTFREDKIIKIQSYCIENK